MLHTVLIASLLCALHVLDDQYSEQIFGQTSAANYFA